MAESAATTEAVIQIFLALVGVVALIIASGWVMRRFSAFGGQGQGQLKIVASIAVGSRERLAIVEVAGRQILVGITAQQISPLMVIKEPVDFKAVESPFAQNLQSLLQRSKDPAKGPVHETHQDPS